MNIPVGWGILLLVAVAASAAVRLVAALVSARVRSSVLRHPVAHIIWFLIGLSALVFMLTFGVPRRVHSRVYWQSANRVGGRIDLPPPTPPSKRVRTRRFRLD
jgi:hypothetical protein